MKHAILVSVVASFIISVLFLSDVFTKGKVIVTNEAGQPVAGASVWVSKVSAAHAPEFFTNKKGVARLPMDDYGDVAVIGAGKGNLHGNVSGPYFTWPLRVTIRPR